MAQNNNIKDFYKAEIEPLGSFGSEQEFTEFISDPKNAKDFFEAEFKESGSFANSDEFVNFLGVEKKNSVGNDIQPDLGSGGAASASAVQSAESEGGLFAPFLMGQTKIDEVDVDVFGTPKVEVKESPFTDEMKSVLKTIDTEALVMANEIKKQGRTPTPAEIQGIADKYGITDRKQYEAFEKYLKAGTKGEKTIEKEEYKIDGKLVTPKEFRSALFDKNNIDKLQDGNLALEYPQQDEEISNLVEKQKNAGTRVGDTWDSLVQGVYEVSSGIIGAQSYVNRVMRSLVTEEYAPTYSEMMSRYASTQLKKKAEDAGEKIRAYEGGFIDAIRNREVGNAVSMSGNMIANMLPLIGIGVVTGGSGAMGSAGIMSGIMASSELAGSDELKKLDGTELTEGEKVLRATLYGGAEGVFGALPTAKILGKNIAVVNMALKNLTNKAVQIGGVDVATEFAQQSGKETAKQLAKEMGIDQVSEVFGEVLTTVGQAVIDNSLGVTNKSGEEIANEALETAALTLSTLPFMEIPRGYKLIKAYRDGKIAKGGAQLLRNKVKEKVKAGQFTEDEGAQAEVSIDKREKAVNAVPEKYQGEPEIVDAIQNKQELEEKAKEIDPVFQEEIKQQIDEANVAIQGLISQKKAEQEQPISETETTENPLADVESTAKALEGNPIVINMSLPMDSGVNTGLVKNSKGAVYHDRNSTKLENLGYSKEQIDNLSQTELNEILAKNIQNPNVETSAKLPLAEKQTTTQEFLDEASKEGGRFAELAKTLKEFFGIDGVKTEIVKGLKDFFGKNLDGDYANNKIKIDDKAKNKLQTFLHEAIHKVTVDKLLQFERGDYTKLSKQDIEALQNLTRIFNESKVKIHEFLGGGKGDRTKGYYGFTNVHEFISEAFTNPEFQNLLKNLPTEGKNPTIFKQFLDAVAKFLGLKDASILNDIFYYTENLKSESLLSKPQTPPALRDVESTAKALELQNMSDADLQKAYEQYSQSKDFDLRVLSSMIENIQEKNERNSILNSALNKVSEVIDNILSGNEYFIEKSEGREAKSIAQKYMGEVSKKEAQKDFKDAFFGNPESWVADALKMRESVRVYIENGGTFKDLLSSVKREFESDGFTEQDAASVIKNKLEGLSKKDFRQNQISEAYHKAKADGSNPELVKAVEDLLAPKTEEASPIKQLGTGANVYFETEKYRVNDNLKNGKVFLNVGDVNSEMPLVNIEFDNPKDAVKVAEVLNSEFPKGMPDYIDVEKYVQATKEQLLTPKTETNAKEQQSGEMREQIIQEQPQGESDSNMPIVNEAELQDGKAVEEEVKPKPKKEEKEKVIDLDKKKKKGEDFLKNMFKYGGFMPTDPKQWVLAFFASGKRMNTDAAKDLTGYNVSDMLWAISGKSDATVDEMFRQMESDLPQFENYEISSFKKDIQDIIQAGSKKMQAEAKALFEAEKAKLEGEDLDFFDKKQQDFYNRQQEGAEIAGEVFEQEADGDIGVNERVEQAQEIVDEMNEIEQSQLLSYLEKFRDVKGDLDWKAVANNIDDFLSEFYNLTEKTQNVIIKIVQDEKQQKGINEVADIDAEKDATAQRAGNEKGLNQKDKRQELLDKVKQAEDELKKQNKKRDDFYNNDFVIFDPKSRAQTDIDLLAALGKYVKAKLQLASYDFKTFLSDIKDKGIELSKDGEAFLKDWFADIEKTAVKGLINKETGVTRPKPTEQKRIDKAAAIGEGLGFIAGEITGIRKGIKEGSARHQEAIKNITELVKDAFKNKTIDSRTYNSVITRIGNAKTPLQIERVMDYIEKVADDASYIEAVAEVKSLQQKAKSLSKQKNIPINHKQVLEGIAKIDIDLVENLAEYRERLNDYMRNFLPITNPNYKPANSDEMLSYLDKLQKETDSIYEGQLKRLYGIESEGLSAKEIMEAIESEDIDDFMANMSETKRTELTKLLTKLSEYAKLGLDTVSTETITSKEKQILDKLKNIPVEKLSNNQKKEFIKTADNISLNGKFFGAEKIAALSDALLGMPKALSDAKGIKIRKALNVRGLQLEQQIFSISDMFRNFFGIGEAMAKVQNDMGMGKLIMGQRNYVKEMKKAQLEISDFFKGLKKKYKDFNSKENKIAEGMASYLIQPVPNQDEANSFQIRKDIVFKDLQEKAKYKETADQANIGMEVFSKLEKAKSNKEIFDILKKEYPSAFETINFYKDKLLPKYKEQIQQHQELFFNNYADWSNQEYLPIAYTKVPGEKIKDQDEQYFQTSTIPTPKQSPNTIRRSAYTTLPKDRLINYNLRANVFNGLTKNLYDLNTAYSWQQMKDFMSLPEAEILFGGKDNVNFVNKKLNSLRSKQQRTGVVDSDEFSKTLEGASNVARRYAVSALLGGFFQAPKQMSEQVVSAAINNNFRFDKIGKNMLEINQAKELLDKFGIGGRKEIRGGTTYDNAIESGSSAMQQWIGDGKAIKAKEVLEKLEDFWMKSLTQGDYLAASSAWMTFYESYLNKKGTEITDWKNEANLVDTDPTRMDAAVYAETMTDITQVSSDTSKLADISKKGSSGYENVIKTILLPFSTFAVQMRARIINDSKDFFSFSDMEGRSRASAGKSLLATMAGMAAFHTTNIYLLGLVKDNLTGLILNAFGIDDTEDEEEAKKQAAFKFKMFYSNMTRDLFASGFGQIAENGLIDAMNWTAFIILAQLDDPSTKKKNGETMDYKYWKSKTEKTPFYRYGQWEESAFGLGLYDFVLEKPKDLYLQGEKLASEEIDDKYKPLILMASISEMLHSLRLNDADVNRIIQQAQKKALKNKKDSKSQSSTESRQVQTKQVQTREVQQKEVQTKEIK